MNEQATTGQWFESTLLPMFISVDEHSQLSATQLHALHAIQKRSARIATATAYSMSKRLTGRPHLGVALDLIPALTLTQSVLPAGAAHFSVAYPFSDLGCFSVLAALGFISKHQVSDYFAQSLDHTRPLPQVAGGAKGMGETLTELIPIITKQARAMQRESPETAWTICHTGCMDWSTFQKDGGDDSTSFHQAPITFVLHRNGMDLSGTSWKLFTEDLRPVFDSLGIEILEIKSLMDTHELYEAFRAGRQLALDGRSGVIYPTGYTSTVGESISLDSFAAHYDIAEVVAPIAAERKISLDKEIWVPGSLFNYRNLGPMLEALFFVNELSGGSRKENPSKLWELEDVMKNPMLIDSEEEIAALERLENENPVMVISDPGFIPETDDPSLPEDHDFQI